MGRHKLGWAAIATAWIFGLTQAISPTAGAQTPPGGGQATLSPALAKALATNVNQRVIVVLKNQAPSIPDTPAAKRASALGPTQRPVLKELSATGATSVHAYTLINAISATLSQGEVNRLKANPTVSEVVPDDVIKLASPQTVAEQTAASLGAAQTPLPGACAPPGQVQLDPQAIEQIHADSDDPSAPTAASLGVTGTGVSVAFIADGLDIDNPDFIRPNGQPVFVDYKDFSGEGTSVPTGGGEAFLDASSVAAQGNEVYNVANYSALPLNQPCDIRIVGVAPGASLVGLDIFGAEDAGYNSEFLQAIDYAVSVDHVDVLNESLGSNDFADDPASLDLIKMANDLAIAAGTTVVTSSGDAGITNTIGSPATDPEVISAGATTTYRIDAQDGYGGARFPGVTGWLDNNTSSLSSSGFTQNGSTVSLVAPGELNWALCSTDVAAYDECTNLAGKPSPVQQTGGTSESSPLTAGAAALVIEAYRNTHGGASPSPALVKQILTTTADDLGLPADQQGAGLVDAYKAVQAAESYRAALQAPPAPVGETLLTSAGQINAVATPATVENLSETITNNGAATQTLNLSTRAIGTFTSVGPAQTVTLDDAASPQMTDWQGVTDNVESVTFVVPPGQDRLNAAISFVNSSASDLAARVRMTLIDPAGALSGYSLPQGDGNYGDIQVTEPVPGTWTAYIYSRDSADGGTTGPVVFGASVATYVPFGTVSPSMLTLAPGASAPVMLTVPTPATPGDAAGAILISAPAGEPSFGAVTTVPVTLRSLMPAGTTSFSGVLTGGNGRQGNLGQTSYYQVDLPAGLPEINASVVLGDNPNNQFYAWLVDPSGQAEAFSSNNLVSTNAAGLAASNTLGAQLHALAPAAGMWTLIVDFAPQVSGSTLSEPFSVAMDEMAVPAAAPNLPNSLSASLQAGTPETYGVSVTNTGSSPEAYFLDGRLTSPSQYDLTALNSPTTNVPLNYDENLPIYLVPPDTTEVDALALTPGTGNIQFDNGSVDGDPDVASNVGTLVQSSFSADPVVPGAWYMAPVTVGPFGVSATTSEPVETAMLATTPAFDPAISSPTGDLWIESLDPAGHVQHRGG